MKANHGGYPSLLLSKHLEAFQVFSEPRFAKLNKISKYLDSHRLAVTEAVFGVLLAALAIQLILDGLAELGIVDMMAH